MSANSPLQSSHSDVKPWSLRELKVLDLGIGNRRVVYGAKVRPRLEILDEHIEVNLKDHGGDILIAVRLSGWSGEETRFATTGYDDRIVIWDIHGQIKDVLHGHVARIGALWELPDKRLASWGEDWSLIVWDLQRADKKKKGWQRIPTFCSRQRVLVDTAGGFFCLSEYWQARIVDFEGVELARLKWQFAPITAIRRLTESADRWITQTKSGIKLWSKEGALQRKIPHTFSFDDGYLELPGAELLVIDDGHHFDVLNSDGLPKAGRGKDEALARQVKKFLRTRKAAEKALEARSSYEHFRYRTNPLSALEPVSEEDAGAAAKPVKRKMLSSFFERSDLRAVRTWLRAELDVASAARNRVDTALHDDRVISARARFLIGFSIACGFAAVLALFKQRGTEAQFGLALAVMSALGAAWWAQLKIFAMDSAERVMARLAREIDQFVANVRDKRRYILTDVPALRIRASSAENTIREQIRHTITHLTDTVVFRECGVAKEQLLNQDRRPIVFTDWSALRLGELAQVPERNLNSFWWGVDGQLVFAVHHIQFVLLTPWRVDIFRLDYDFIAGRIYNKSALTLYYGEVTDVVKRAVSRPLTVGRVTANVDAMELVLVLRSGESVVITLMEESAAALRDAVRKQAVPVLQDQLRNLDSEDTATPPPPDYARKALAMERRLVKAELDALTVEVTSSDSEPAKHLDGVIASLRRHVLARKEPAAHADRAQRQSSTSELS